METRHPDEFSESNQLLESFQPITHEDAALQIASISGTRLPSNLTCGNTYMTASYGSGLSAYINGDNSTISFEDLKKTTPTTSTTITTTRPEGIWDRMQRKCLTLYTGKEGMKLFEEAMRKTGYELAKEEFEKKYPKNLD